MKKYETPSISLRVLDTAAFLEISGDATAVDTFNDSYGKSFADL